MGKSKVIKDRSILYGTGASYRPKNLFIEAGAGAGKTDYIIKKIVDELLQGVDPSKFIVITFTNKATEEMLGRIIDGINERVKDTKTFSEDERKTLQKAKDRLFEMNVSTIHSFCNKLLNENSFKGKLSYGAELLVEDDENKRSNTLYYQWLKTLKDSDYSLLNKDGSSDLLRAVKTTYDVLCKNFDDVQIDSSFNFSINKYLTFLNEVVEILEDGKAGGANYGKAGEKLLDAFANFESVVTDVDRFDKDLKEQKPYAVEALKDMSKAISLNVKFGKPNEDLNDELKPCLDKLIEQRNILKEVLERIDTPIINEYALKAWDYFKTHRDRESLSNNQLIYETYLLLKNNPTLCDELAKKYDVIFIDEFQDTDKCQIEFVTKLARAIYKRKKKEGKSSTSFVVVGDPKQSIYRFRGADFHSFSKVQNEFETYGNPGDFERIFFPDNFRSSNYIINYVNREYANRTLAKGYVYEPMLIHPTNEIPTTFSPDKLLAGVYSYPFNNEALPNAKFANLARFIYYLVKNKYQVPHKNKIVKPDGTTDYEIKLYDVEYKDFLVLSCGHKEMSDYVEALNELNIPSQVAGEFDLSSSETLRVIYRVLSYLLDNQQNNELLIRKTIEIYVDDVDKTINKLKEETKGMSAYGVFYYVLTNLSLIFARFTDTDSGLYHAVSEQLFEKICVNDFVSGTDLLNRIDELLKTPAESEIKLDPESNTVRLMNIHKSKGLQGRIVIMVDSGGFNESETCKFSNSTLYLNNLAIYPDINEQAKQETYEERVRLEYVGVTRSEQVLIFESNFKGKRLFNWGENIYNFTNEYLKDYHYPETFLPLLEEVDEYLKDEISITSAKKATFIPITKIDENKKIKHINETSPSLLEDHSDTTRRIIEPRRPYDNVFGTTFHRVMELYVKNNNQNEDDIIAQAIKENINDIDELDVNKYESSLKECLRSVVSFYSSTKYLESAKEKKPEFKFIDFDDSIYGTDNTIMSGSIDLLLFNEDGSALIIDYKTDIAKFHDKKQFESLLASSYKNQLETYVKVVNKLFGIKDIKAKIIWMEENKDTTIAHEITIV